MTGLTIDEIALGEVAEVTHTVTPETIREFVEASGDDNPIHSDPVFAAATRFGRVIAPGMLTGGFISGVIGTRLPGPGTVYLSQSFRFLKPVFVGDRVTARVEVAERLVEKNRLRLVTTCRNQEEEALLEGEAWVLPSKTRIEYAGRRTLVVATEPTPPTPPTPPIPVVPRPSPRSTPESVAQLAWAPAALPVQLASLWMEGALALTGHALGFWLPVRFTLAPVAPASVDPIRP